MIWIKIQKPRIRTLNRIAIKIQAVSLAMTDIV